MPDYTYNLDGVFDALDDLVDCINDLVDHINDHARTIGNLDGTVSSHRYRLEAIEAALAELKTKSSEDDT